jgi:YggT family protein
VLETILLVVRYAIAAVFLLTCLVAAVYWAVRRKKLNAFGPVARFTRRLAEPVVRPLERRVIRWGGNPQDAPLWLVGIVLVLGLVLLSLIKWLVGSVAYVSSMAQGGPRSWITMLIDLVYFVLTTALLLRVLGSWIGVGRYNRWMRFAYTLTDWIVEPIRRMLPSFRFIDFSPLIAWLALWLIRGVLSTMFRI